MDIRDVLKKDHREILHRLKSMKENSDAEMENRFDEVKQLLRAHSEAEHRTLYHDLDEEGNEETRLIVYSAEAEHDVVDFLVEQMEQMSDKQSERFQANCQVLYELVKHHIDEEEKKMFAHIPTTFGEEDIGRIGDQFRSEEMKLGGLADRLSERPM